LLLSVFLQVSSDQPEQLQAIKAVSQRWRNLAEEVAPLMFLQQWHLAAVCGKPRSQRFYMVSDLSSFVHEHKCGCLDTLSAVAVRYSSDVHTIKRVNNLISENALFSRERIFVPVASAGELDGQTVTLKWCPIVCRQFAVLNAQPDATAFGDMPLEANKQPQEQSLGKLSVLLSRGLRIDEAQAQFYLVQAGGDIKAAIRLQREDAAWEHHHR